MNITGILDGENITVKNLTGNVSESAIVYIDSSDNLIVKTAPIQDRNKIILAGVEDFNTVFDSYSQLPNGNKIGQIASVKNLTNNGTFLVEWDGSRWFVRPGENIVSNRTEKTWVTSAGDIGNFLPVDSFTIPAGLIGDLENWSFSFLIGQIGGVSAGANCIRVMDSSATLLPNSNLFVNTVPYSYDVAFRRFRRSENILKRNSSGGAEGYASGEITVSIDHSLEQTIQLQQKATNTGEVWFYNRFIIRREC